MLLLLITQSSAAQYTNPYSGATWNNSFSRVMDMTRTWNQNLWDAQKNLQRVTDQTAAKGSANNRSSSASTSTPPPPSRQFPITATDFSPLATRLVPQELANAMPGLTPEQKGGLRDLYLHFLTEFEKEARKNNIANSFAFLLGVSMQVAGGREVNEAEADRLIAFFNNTLPNIPQFNALAPQQKQILYESLIITGGTIGWLYGTGVQQNNPAMQQQAKQLAQVVLRQLTGMQN